LAAHHSLQWSLPSAASQVQIACAQVAIGAPRVVAEPGHPRPRAGRAQPWQAARVSAADPASSDLHLTGELLRGEERAVRDRVRR
jgi:hypothetical protein